MSYLGGYMDEDSDEDYDGYVQGGRLPTAQDMAAIKKLKTKAAKNKLTQQIYKNQYEPKLSVSIGLKSAAERKKVAEHKKQVVLATKMLKRPQLVLNIENHLEKANAAVLKKVLVVFRMEEYRKARRDAKKQ